MYIACIVQLSWKGSKSTIQNTLQANTMYSSIPKLHVLCHLIFQHNSIHTCLLCLFRIPVGLMHRVNEALRFNI